MSFFHPLGVFLITVLLLQWESFLQLTDIRDIIILEEDDRFKLSISYELSQYHSPDVAVYSANTVFCLDTNAYTIMVSLYLICISGMYIARNLNITFYDDEGGSKILRYCLLNKLFGKSYGHRRII